MSSYNLRSRTRRTQTTQVEEVKWTFDYDEYEMVDRPTSRLPRLKCIVLDADRHPSLDNIPMYTNLMVYGNDIPQPIVQ